MAVAICLIVTVACIWQLFAYPRIFVRDAIDFRSFYCAARAVASGQSPYLAEPLRTCEARASKEAGVEPVPGLALPAPLPGYAFLAFLPLAMLPYLTANIGYDLLLLVATIGSVVLLARLTQLPPIIVVAALGIGEGFQALRFGQIVPIVLLLLMLAALLLECSRPWSAALALGAAMIEPHVALPALLTTCVFLPRIRLPIACVCMLLACLSLLAIGAEQTLLYMRSVLPAHAHAELHMNSYQFSLTNLLSQLGMADAPALRLGYISYFGMGTLGAALSSFLARRTSRPAFLVLGPCAFSLLGGPFLHLVQITCALPFALLLLTVFPGNLTLIIASIFLAIPWLEIARVPHPFCSFFFSALTALPIAWHFYKGRHRRALSISLSLAAALLSLSIAEIWQHAPAHSPNVKAALAPVRGANLLAESSWQAYVQEALSAHEERYIVAKLPTWAGLLLLLGSGSAFALKPIDA